jgi:hypothetical protein
MSYSGVEEWRSNDVFLCRIRRSLWELLFRFLQEDVLAVPGVNQTKHEKSSLFYQVRMSQLHLKREIVKSREAFSIGFISASVNTRIGHSQLSAKNKLRASAQ